MYKKLILKYNNYLMISLRMDLLKDKFDIFSKRDYIKNTDYSFENYIENYLNDNILYHYSLIKSEDYEYSKIIFQIKNYFKKIRNNFARASKYGRMNIIDVINFLKKFNMKTEYIYITFLNNNIYKDSYNIDVKNIEYDTIISHNYLKNILTKEINNRNDIKQFYNYIIFYYNKTAAINITNIINTLSDIFLSLSPIEDDILLKSTFTKYTFISKLFDYYIEIKNKYSYFNSVDKLKVYDDKYYKSPFEILIKNINNEIKYVINDNKCFLIFLDIFSDKIEKVGIKSLIESLLLFKPENIKDLIQFMYCINKIKVPEKQIILDELTCINNNLLDEESIKYIAKKINNNIINKRDSIYLYILGGIYNRKYIDLFISLLEMYLMKRYIYYENFDYVFEYEQYNIITEYINKKKIYRYLKIITDCSKKKNINNITYNQLSYDIWPFNIEKGYCNTIYSNYNIECDIDFNNVKTSNRYYLHLGKLEFEFTTDEGVYNIVGLPIHYNIITSIINNNIYVNLINNNYDKKYIDSLFKQLYDNNLIIKINENTKEPNDLNNYMINSKYNNGDINLIHLNEEIIENKMIEFVEQEIAHKKKHIIMANISSILKKQDKSYNYIYNLIKNRLSYKFDIDEELFESCIQEMIKKDYINYSDDNDRLFKIVY